jgi:hypothetical protein
VTSLTIMSKNHFLTDWIIKMRVGRAKDKGSKRVD